MRPAEHPLIVALALLDDSGATITLNEKVSVKASPAMLELVGETLKEHRELLYLVALGRADKPYHALCPCSVCGEVSMVALTADRLAGRAKWPECRFNGSHELVTLNKPVFRLEMRWTIGTTWVGCPGRHVPSDPDIERARRAQKGRAA